MRDERCSRRLWTLLTCTRTPGFLPMADCWLSGAVPALVMPTFIQLTLRAARFTGLDSPNSISSVSISQPMVVKSSSQQTPPLGESAFLKGSQRESHGSSQALPIHQPLAEGTHWFTRRIGATTISGKSICRVAPFSQALARCSFHQPDMKALLSFRLMAAEFCLRQPVPQ